MRLFLMILVTLFTTSAFAVVGSTSVTKSSISYDGGKKVRVVELDWTGSTTDGSVPTKTIEKMHGFLMKMVTNPGSTAPTDNYDIAINDADGLDALITQGANRDTANTEAVYPVTAAGQLPLFFPPGTYYFALSNSTTLQATGVVKLYFVDSL